MLNISRALMNLSQVSTMKIQVHDSKEETIPKYLWDHVLRQFLFIYLYLLCINGNFA